MSLMHCPKCGAAIDAECSDCRTVVALPKTCATCQGTGRQKVSLNEMIKLFSRPINSGAAAQLQQSADFSDGQWHRRNEAIQLESEARARQLHTFDEHDMTEFECVMCRGRGTIDPG